MRYSKITAFKLFNKYVMMTTQSLNQKENYDLGFD